VSSVFGVSVVHHLLSLNHLSIVFEQKRQLVPDGARLYNGFYFHRITYNQADLASMRAVIQKSTRCRQYISFDCFKSKILSAPVGPATAQWLSGSGTLHSYWGGAPSNSHMCACGVTGTCDDPTKRCNCDIADDKWRQDAGNGFINQYQSSLP